MSVEPRTARDRRLSDGRTLALAVAAVMIALLVGYEIHGRSSGGGGGEQGSGNSVTQARQLGSFEALDLTGATAVRLTIGSPRAVSVTADDNLLDNVTTDVRSGRLLVGTVGSFSTRTPMTVDVTVPSVSALMLSGSGMIDAGGIDASALTITMSGSGLLHATGTVDRLDVSLPGSGSAQLAGLVAQDVKADVGGSGLITVRADRSLNATVSGSGAILYGGDVGAVTTNITGSGAVTRTG